MNIIRYQTPSTGHSLFAPFTRLSAFSREMDRLLDLPRLHWEDQALAGWTPAVDLYQDNGAIVLRAELPGMKREDIQVSLHDDTLVLAGERRQEKLPAEKGHLRNERFYGRFERRFTLPVRINPEQVSAHYENGILTVRLPKADEVKPRQVEVQVK